MKNSVVVLLVLTTLVLGALSLGLKSKEDPTIKFWANRKQQSNDAFLRSNLTSNELWPKPQQTTGGDRALYIAASDFAVTPVGPNQGPILSSAIRRYVNRIFFPWPAISVNPPPANTLYFLQVQIVKTYDETLHLGTDESYNISVIAQNNTALLKANTVFGIIRGLETFSQMIQFNFRTRSYQVGDFHIVDFPKFAYRGVMVDNARRFMTISALTTVIDAMSYYKLNTLHLHLIDTDSWPIEIEGYPLLTQLNAYFPVENHVYTPNQMRQLVYYALERGIRIVPEIDTPGHSFPLCVAYPEFCVTYTYRGKTLQGLYPDPTNNKTWAFLEQLWTKMAEIFPSDQFHIGSDEMWFGQWQDSPAVLQFMKEKGYTDVVDVFYYYQRRMIDIMRKLGKKTVGWYPGLDTFPNKFNGTFYDYPDVSVTLWNGAPSPFNGWTQEATQLVKGKLHMILTTPYWVELPQRDERDNTQYTPSWQFMYGYDALDFPGVESEKREYMLGGELTAWDDTAITDSGNLPVGLTPYLGAVGENWWTGVKNGTQPNYQRYTTQRCRTIVRGVPSNPLSGSDIHPFRCYQEYEYPAREWSVSGL